MRSSESDCRCQLSEVHYSDGQLEWRNSAGGRIDQSGHLDEYVDVTFGGFIGNGASLGVQPLTLPFVQGANGAAQQIQIIRKRFGGELRPLTGSSREFNKANIRIFLASTQADLVPDRPALVGDPDNVNLDNACVGGRTDLVPGVEDHAVGYGSIARARLPRRGWPWLPAAALLGIPEPVVDCRPAVATGRWLAACRIQNAAGAWIGVTRVMAATWVCAWSDHPNRRRRQRRTSQCHSYFSEAGRDRNLSGTHHRCGRSSGHL